MSIKVTAFKNLDVEFEAEIEFEDVLKEFSHHVDESSDKHWRRVVLAMDWMTRIMASIKDEVIDGMPKAAKNTLCERLHEQSIRYFERAKT